VKKKKKVRIAGVITGATALAAVTGGIFAPTARANSRATSPNFIRVLAGPNVQSAQVCAWSHVGGGEWTCTGVKPNPGWGRGIAGAGYSDNMSFSYGLRGNGWNDGKVNVWLFQGAHDRGITCNTNGTYTGGLTNHGRSVSLSTGRNPGDFTYSYTGEC
jgi:hypothetical protein